ncbi:DUF427 domain-containing protein [Arthrobacter caoxuetaonis]|uniref:DUF427 domain-containing protein n=1 Tax=Arthrobacter caoxuetaonis TaxID=2886935 RepID=A0A9X1MER9_9MICC|nr:DUF427 domain-containing protein [Arthrobacter caoxuetaonis]MCC3281612.1 DUF427 domain-containing protein [Arthrobacter caoxuetaonis]MCC3298719.1 DUF427 domain-containing protein [Arthrobacter caoxuetaonis]USQ57452.1 DUF427 domain-containing protein [Arthrobacter caoxuetaonis]
MENRYHPHAESVWSYPRPPRVEPSSELVQVWLGGSRIVETRQALRVLETSHPPVYYLPLEAFAPDTLHPVSGVTHCEYKGTASYYDVVSGSSRAARGAWTYPHPAPGYEALAATAALYPGLMDSVLVDGEEVQPQEGDFYGGWITSRVTGPFKGAPGTWGW